MRGRPQARGLDRAARSCGTLLLLLGASGALGCGGSKGAGSTASPPDSEHREGRGITTHIREGFDNRDFVEESDNVEIDFNNGLVRLPIELFPEIKSDQPMHYAGDVEQNGTVSADQILLAGHLRASDSIELLARDVLKVSGEIHAGVGGVTLAAGERIIVDGVIESEGPIKILLGREAGAIEITGRITAISSFEKRPASVRLIARGRVLISGEITTTAETGLPSGDIAVHAYGAIEIRGAGAVVSATFKDDGPSGRVQLKSEADVVIDEGASVGGDTGAAPRPPAAGQRGFLNNGGIEIQAERVTIGSGAKVTAASSVYGTGGSVLIMAGTHLLTRDRSMISSGAGVVGGGVTIRAGSARFESTSRISGGSGLQVVSPTRIETAKGLFFGNGASVAGGDGVCTTGGDIGIQVGGQLALALGARISGGAGARDVFTLGCSGLSYPGGSVELIARAAIGLEGAVSGGSGATPGSVRTTIDPWYTHPAPNLTVTSRGWVQSRVIDRGDAARGQRPTLVEYTMSRPTGTKVEILLAGSNSETGPAAAWEDMLGAPAELSAALSQARYFRYRVALHGRAFETPTVTYFDIDLAPGTPPER